MVLIRKFVSNLSFKCEDHCSKDKYNKKSSEFNDDYYEKKEKDRFKEFKEDFFEKCEDIQEMFIRKSHKD